ncbi:MAG: hypothetical protein HY332_02650 [Chloroflexi bacterium]|nr:hypothetical protein [Chloroflexota bacterium]
MTLTQAEAGVSRQDWRNIATGSEIPREGYCDQPYVVVNDDGSWLCVLTTGPGLEGDSRQHVVSTISRDQGRTWLPLVDIEPHGPPEASWVMPVKGASGRVYAIYVHNSDNRREVRQPDGTVITRVDTLGHYVCKYSDDGGRTWSRERYEIPVREFQIDRENVYGGQVRFFWGVGKPIVHDGAVYFGAAKVGNFGEGFMAASEGFFMRSDNLLTEPDAAKIRWETLPDGDVGLRAPLGPVADEHNLVALSDGSLYCTYRTVEGYLCHAYSRDGGHTWDGPQYATHAPGDPMSRRIKHPRAANFVRKFSNGKYLLWCHNHGGRWYHYRNPGWVCGGVERNGTLHWSEPEILLYDDDPEARISYPDFIEHGGRYFITETQKSIARVHEIDVALLEGVWRQGDLREIARDGLALSVRGAQCASGRRVALPALPDLSQGGGFTLDLWVELGRREGGQVLLDGRDAQGHGIVLETAGTLNNCTLQLMLDDGRYQGSWDCDPWVLATGRPQHVVAVVDGGPRIISFVVDGRFCDGGMARQYGWGRFHRRLSHVNGAGELTLAPALDGRLHSLRLYRRYLRTSEAVGNWRAGWRET